MFKAIILLLLSHARGQEKVTDPIYENLFKWMEEGGAEFKDIEFMQSRENMRGVYARQNITKGDTILFVPRSLLMVKE